jgi:glycolate oxidase FAD binding subunit
MTSDHEPAALTRLRERVRSAAADHAALRIRAGGTKDFYGNPCDGALLDPRELAGIVDYEPTELVVTVRSGTPLAELEKVLAERNQMLPFEPPHYGAGATVGGTVAAGLAGPRRVAAGAVRDFVLGARLLDGRGALLTFGGRVMKNVAGYDMARVLAGSLGTLGVITDVSIKLLPKPVAECTLRFELDEATAIERLNEWGGKPLPITASVWLDGTLYLRLSGANAGVTAARSRLGGEVAEEARWWADLREQRHEFFRVSGDEALWRLAVPPTTKPLALGPTLIEWNGGQRWLRGRLDAERVRAAAAGARGHATRFRGGDGKGPTFHPLEPVLARLHQRLKAEFDPAGIFNPGRLIPVH